MTENNEGWAELLSWAGILVPIVLVFVMALIRSIAKGNAYFSRENLCLGIDLCFAGLAAALVEATDLLRQHVEKPDDSQLSRIIIVLLLSFGNSVCLLVVTKLHQRWDVACPLAMTGSREARERRQVELDRQHKNKQIIWLLLASNLLGFATIVVFAWLRARKIV